MRATTGDIWIGLSNRGAQQEWMWLDGSELTYTSWNFGQPDSVSNDYYMYYDYDLLCRLQGGTYRTDASIVPLFFHAKFILKWGVGLYMGAISDMIIAYYNKLTFTIL